MIKHFLASILCSPCIFWKEFAQGSLSRFPPDQATQQQRESRFKTAQGEHDSQMRPHQIRLRPEHEFESRYMRRSKNTGNNDYPSLLQRQPHLVLDLVPCAYQCPAAPPRRAVEQSAATCGGHSSSGRLQLRHRPKGVKILRNPSAKVVYERRNTKILSDPARTQHEGDDCSLLLNLSAAAFCSALYPLTYRERCHHRRHHPRRRR